MGDPSDTIVVSDVAPRTASQQITGFIDDAASVPASLPVLREPEDSMIAATMEERTHSIVDVLSRPVVVASGTWTDNSVRDDTLVTLDFPDTLFNSAVNIVDKLNYFTYLRADVCLRVVINANTFQQGKLLGYFTPFESLVGNRASVSNHTPAFTAFPHVLLDASTGNVAELRIPYVSPYSSYRLSDNTGNIGTFYLRILNALKSGNCEYTVYAWFTNISVDLPSGRENALGTAGSALNAFKRFLRTKPDLVASTKSKNGKERFVAQVAGEESTKSRGIVSATFDTIATVASLGNEIPIVKEVAGPVSWVAKFAARVAEYFGYSKSVNLATPCSMIQIPGKGFTNASGVDNSVVLASTQDNLIEPRNDVFGSGVDDMAIPYLVKHRCYVDSFTMATTQTANTLLYAFPVTPGWCKLVSGVYRPSVTSFVASMFTLWRGGLKFKIQAAKTAYHSGRVRIVYLPATESSDVDDADQAYNWVLDLRNSSEIEFTVPYNNIVEWSESRLIDGIANTRSSSVGVIRIEVLNTLRAPDTVSQDIEFNVWMSGDSDLQFAIPSFQRYVPSLANPTLSRRRPDLNEVFTAQVLGSQQDRGFNDMADKPQLFSMKVPDLVVPCKTAIGEAVNNLRYITRRFAPVFTATKQTSADLFLDLPLYYFTRVFDPSLDSLDAYRITPMDYISYLYRFFRGGTRYKFMLNNSNIADSTGYQEAILAPSFPSSRSITTVPEAFYTRLSVMSSSFMHRVYSLINPILEVTLPFYSQAIVRPIVGADVAQPDTLTANSLLYKWSSGASDATVDVFRAAHDDFTFGWIVGPPTLRSRDSSEVDIDVSEAGITNVSATSLSVFDVTLDEVLTPGTYSIVLAVPATADLVLTDTSTKPMTPVSLTVSNTGNFITFEYENTDTGLIDQPATVAGVQLIGTIGVLLA
nr:structural protein [Mute swan feces associated picorna-like virus 22]